ncbi:hypothetical protein MicloDRAFT_00025030 [Microvirga lotononidis]|uniref:Uncharacterized protein n=1 Tax=Microvirga lotononidis TaxID=864069 RepID=I4YY16_9HYPH|nr:hypothetical protein MicloDRAFT_00025030 [Microvirga lotononidis]
MTRSPPAAASSSTATCWGDVLRHDVTAGLVPVIPMRESAAPHTIEIAGTRPAMTVEMRLGYFAKML